MEGEGTMWKNYKVLLVYIFMVGLLCGCSREEELYPLGHTEQTRQEADEEEAVKEVKEAGDDSSVSSASVSKSVIYVHVCGAVAMPGVVEIPAGSRAQAAIDAAGGFSESADTAYVNLAAPIEDGEQLFIPTKEEAEALRKNQAAVQNGIVNLNTADVRLLCTLPGIGESRAGDIVAYRLEHGGFTDTKEIMQVPGIKESTYEKIKDLITAD